MSSLVFVDPTIVCPLLMYYITVDNLLAYSTRSGLTEFLLEPLQLKLYCERD